MLNINVNYSKGAMAGISPSGLTYAENFRTIFERYKFGYTD